MDAFKRAYLVFSILVFILISARAMLVPFSHDEVATFLFYVQPGDFIPFYAHADANGHFLVNLCCWICYKIFGSEVWSLRLPCIAALAVLLLAVYRCSTLFNSWISRTVFAAAFLMSYNFLGYFSLCRGYGFSMAFLLLSLFHLFTYQGSGRTSHALRFLLYSQIALSANLTLVIVLLLLDLVLIVHMIRLKRFFKGAVLLALLVNFILIFIWLRYAFFLKNAGALYYGEGESYWQVTFHSLIVTLFGAASFVPYLLIIFFAFTAIMWVLNLRGELSAFINVANLPFLIFLLLAAGFFLLNFLLGVNYPEDRTGLFFFIFMVFAFCFAIDGLKANARYLFLAVPAVLLLQSASGFNFAVHPWRFYETVPERFFEKAKAEQDNSDHPLTIGGHRVREFFFGFMNYNHGGPLNHITAPEALQMNCDLSLAYAQDSSWYSPFYEEIDREPYFNFRLLKRKLPIGRVPLHHAEKAMEWKGESEYYNAFEISDSSFDSENPLQADFTLRFNSVPVPFNAWLVLQIDAEDGNVFVRVPLNLVRKDWNGVSKRTLSLVTGRIPKKYKRMVAYLWNIDKKPIDISLLSFSLFELRSPGINVESQAKI